MEKLISFLKSYGLSDKEVKRLFHDITGEDLIQLTNALNLNTLSKILDNTNAILKKYNISLLLENNIIDVFKSDLLDKNYLLEKKFTYVVAINEEELFHVLNILDENHEQYLMLDDSKLAISDKVIFEVNKKIKQLTKRNPIAAGMQKKTGAGVHKDKKETKDQYSRKAKYKKNISENKDYNINLGDHVKYNNDKGIVLDPNGPENTVLIKTKDGIMVSKKQNVKVDEGVIGMSNINSINRIKQLAGIRVQENVPSIPDTIDQDYVDIDIDNNDVGTDGNIDMNITDIPQKVSEVDSIYANIDDIRNKIVDVKVSEFKNVISQLENLIVDIKNMGRSYLGENKDEVRKSKR